MSSDQRIKKLRGSGGYVVASVDDDQQQVGNLGGPDLFLAPIGRISVDKISKYFCNKCEKEYGGAPKIEYENPNEEVAENLVLKEKGKYTCNSCQNVIAEYREFSKPNDDVDVGLAKPMSSDHNQMSEPNVTSQTANAPNVELEITSHSSDSCSSDHGHSCDTHEHKHDSDSSSGHSSDSCSSDHGEHSCMCSSGTPIQTLLDRDIYDGAKRLGKIRKIIVLEDSTISIIVKHENGDKVSIPWNNIKAIGDIILAENNSSIKSGSKCNSCGFENGIDSKFCESCGSSLT